jgi:predicted ATPase/DNA-binding SARP family transcriptional activator
MRFQVLGPVEVAADERRLRIGSAHQRLLLAVLLVARGHPVPIDRLIDALWPREPPVSARRSLHSHVARLRRLLASSAGGTQDTIVTEQQGYRLALDAHELDAARFEAELLAAQAHLGTDPSLAAELMEDALGWWRGQAFGELADHPTLRPEAVRLDRLRATAVGDRIDAYLAAGEHRAVLGELEAAVIDDPAAERAHQQLLLALYRDGRQADATAVYRRLQRTLADQLGIDPAPATRHLYEAILRQDADLTSLARPWPVSPDAGRQDRRAQEGRHAARMLPRGAAREQELIGREGDVTALVAAVVPGALLTLTGPGGVGKSSLARAVATAVRSRFDDEVVVCELSSVRDPGSVPAVLLEVMGITDQGGRTPKELAVAALGTRPVLLLLDNCEHLLPGVSALVEELRTGCPNLSVLATSRQTLRLPGERLHEVGPLSVPPADADAAAVAASEAGRLFCRRALQVEPSFALSEDNAGAIAQLCRQLDGIPLAIELAAARVRALAVSALAARLEHRFELLTGGGHTDAARHRTLQATVQWSYELLTGAEAHLFDRLSVFAGSFDLATAERVCADGQLGPHQIAAPLAELVDKSLVEVDRDGDRVRYRLLDTLRAFGARQLAGSGAMTELRRSHADHHVAVAESLGPAVSAADEGDALAKLHATLDDLRIAHAWSLARAEVEQALRLPAALHDDLVFHPRDEVFTWAERALALDGAAASDAYPAALATAARGRMNRGQLAAARDLAGKALAAADGRGVTSIRSLYVLTTTALYEGRLDEALALAERRRHLADLLDHDYHRALADVSRALAHRYRDDTEAAVSAAWEARASADASGNHTAQAWALFSHGEALLDRDPDTAMDLLAQAIAAARRVDRRFIEGVALVSLASVTGRHGAAERALALFRATVCHWRPLGAQTQQLTTLRNLVDLLVRVGADEPAAVLHGAVTAGATPTFGDEADRLAAAWRRIELHLGADAARHAADRGRGMSTDAMVAAAVATLDTLLGDDRPAEVVEAPRGPIRAGPRAP